MSDDKENIDSLSYVVRSKNRRKVIKIIGAEKICIPSRIADKMGLRVNQISAILRDLKDNDLVVCENEDARVGRLYKLTDSGSEVYNFIKDQKEEF